jgi:hypothetical protein
MAAFDAHGYRHLGALKLLGDADAAASGRQGR